MSGSVLKYLDMFCKTILFIHMYETGGQDSDSRSVNVFEMAVNSKRSYGVRA